MLAGSLVAGTLTDILGRRRLFLFSVALFSVAMIGCAISPSFAVFGACRFITGFGVGGLLPTAVAMASEFADPALSVPHPGRGAHRPARRRPAGQRRGASTWFPAATSAGCTRSAPLALIVVLPLAVVALPESPSYLRSRGRFAEADRIAAHPRPADPRATAPATGTPRAPDRR